MNRQLIWLLALVISARFPTALLAQASSVPRDSALFARATVVHTHSGLTRADIIGDGSPGVILVATRENYNAHGYHAVAIAVQPRVLRHAAPADTDWKIVSATGRARGVDDVLGTEEGADCTLRDFRLVRRAPGKPLTLIVGQRALSKSYADPDSVQFTVYELQYNASGSVGWPTYYFQPTRVIKPARQYCDINVALDGELGLGRDGVAPSEASEAPTARQE